MRTTAILVVAATLFASGFTTSVLAAATQQEKMKSCNAEARTKALKGDERRTFMSGCLAVSPEEKQARLAQREKAKTCTAEAKGKGLKGEEKKTFLTQCVAA